MNPASSLLYPWDRAVRSWLSKIPLAALLKPLYKTCTLSPAYSETHQEEQLYFGLFCRHAHPKTGTWGKGLKVHPKEFCIQLWFTGWSHFWALLHVLWTSVTGPCRAAQPPQQNIPSDPSSNRQPSLYRSRSLSH